MLCINVFLLVSSVMPFVNELPTPKVSYSFGIKREFVVLSCKFFPFRVDLFSEGDGVQETTGSHKSCLPCQNVGKPIKYHHENKPI